MAGRWGVLDPQDVVYGVVQGPQKDGGARAAVIVGCSVLVLLIAVKDYLQAIAVIV